MPYSAVTDLPYDVRAKLSPAAQAVFMRVVNAQLDEGKAEADAFAAAWAAARSEGGSEPYVKAIRIEIAKRDDEQRVVYGWLSVAKDKDGRHIVDKQGDVIPVAELEAAAHDFMLASREAGDMHERVTGIGKVVESMGFTEEKMAKLGIAKGTLPEGWWVGFHIDDEQTWGKVKDGTYKAFSIGGSANREEADAQ
jgi:cation transport regulator ChaB